MKIITIMAVFAMSVSLAQASLIVHYTFDESSGFDVADSSGNGYNSTIITSSGDGRITDGKYGGAFNIGGNKKVDVPVAGLSGLTEVTVGAWVKGSTGTQRFFSAYAAGSEAGNSKVLTLSNGPVGGNFDATAGWTGSTYSSRTVNAANGITDNSVWEHWALTVTAGDGGTTAGSMEVYRNGVLVGSRSIEANRLLTPILYAEIGRDNNGTYQGQIDDFKMYNTAMTATEIQTIAMIPEPAIVGLFGLVGLLVLGCRRFMI